ncbi:MAG: copper resistance D family protein [Deinococcota bacterium]|nr:copper resistance D family protein [Deinococcota bacterium]
MAAALKAGLFIGAVLLLGAGLFSRWVGPELLHHKSKRRLWWGLLAGALVLLTAGLVEVVITVNRAVGGFYPDLALDYLLYTRHGQATLARSGLTVLLLALGLGGRLPGTLDRLGYALFGLGVLASLSMVSHGGAMGPLPLLGDLAHLVGATLWAGAVVYVAWAPSWAETKEALEVAVSRVSSLGVFGVAVLTLTGMYASLLHLYGLSALTETTYGWTLTVKILLVLVILGIAAANRWLLMPKLARGRSSGLRRLVRLESVLLMGVLSVTGVLATREPPHRHDAMDHALHQSMTPPPGHEDHTPAATPSGANTWALASGPVTVTPLLPLEGPLTLVLSPAGTAEDDVTFTVLSPDGTRYPLRAERVPTHHGQNELWLELPALQSGLWQLLAEDEAFLFTVYESALEGGGTFTAVFLPTPSLAGGGRSEVFVHAYEGDQSDARPLFIAYRMPGMAHAGDDERFELESDTRHHDARAFARHASLSFPMVGRWEVTLLFEGDEEQAHAFKLEVTGE